MDWNSNYRYKLLGKLIKSGGELLFVFDLNSAEIYQRAIKDDGKVKTSRTATFPEEWKNQFGLPVEEHKSNIQINTFNGYAVFGLQEEPKKSSKQPEQSEPVQVEKEESPLIVLTYAAAFLLCEGRKHRHHQLTFWRKCIDVIFFKEYSNIQLLKFSRVL